MTALALAVSPAPSIAQEDEAKKERPSESEPAKVTDRSHPDFVRCRTEPVIGSRAKKRKVCLTNRQWEEFARRGNDAARQTVQDNASGMSTN